ncbi:MAG: thioredoxin family protein [Gammaproteobacteria bacterium]
MVLAHRTAEAGTSPRTLEEPDFYRVLAATQGPALIFFTSIGCASCRAWHRLLQEYQSDARGRRRGLSIFSVDAQANMGLVREYEVFHLPALFLFRDGEFHCALHCEARIAELDEAIGAALAGPAQEAP